MAARQSNERTPRAEACRGEAGQVLERYGASELGIKFDFVLSHSILSHAAHWQLSQFLQNTAKVLQPTGKVLASLNLGEENSNYDEWQYPSGSFFTHATVEDVADQHGLDATLMPEYTKAMTEVRPKEAHSWFVFSWKSAGQ